MKILGLIITYLIGLVFVVFGANYFINFMPVPPMEGDIKTVGELLHKTNYMLVVKIMEIVFGLMLILNIKRPLAWLLVLPIIVNIVMFEVLVGKQPGIGVIMLLLNFFMIYMNREKYKGIVS